MKLVLVLCAAAVLLACDDDEPREPADAGNDLDGNVGGQDADTGVEVASCGDDGECDDGIRCNGVERCVDDRCVPGQPVKCTPLHPCLESTGECDCSNPDLDQDGSDAEDCGGDDCADDDFAINENATEVCLPGGDSIDEDCKPATYQTEGTNNGDADGDGHFSVLCFNLKPDGTRIGGDDCLDLDEKTYPEAPEICDYVDNDCDLLVDEVEDADGGDEGTLRTAFYPDSDRDGYPDHDAEPEMRCDLNPVPGLLSADHPDDCDDTKIDINLGELEVCDGVDNDCDGLIDNDDNEATSDQPMLRPYDFEGTIVACAPDLDDTDGDGRKAEWVIPPNGCPEGRAWCTGRIETGCTTDATTVDNCGACGVKCLFSCNEGACDEIVELSVSTQHSCGRTRAGNVACWGRGALGRLGDDRGTGSATPSQVVAASDAKSITAGPVSSCAILGEARALYCWGDNEHKVLGNADPGTGFSPVPLPVLGVDGPVLDEVVSVGIGSQHACASRSNGELYCWGNELNGRLANPYSTGDDYESPLPAEREDGFLVDDAHLIAVGDQHGCLITTNGALECWGSNQFGQLGDPAFSDPFSPVRPVPGVGTVDQVTAGHNHTCVLRGSEVLCWGANGRYQLGREPSAQDEVPAIVQGLPAITFVDAGPTFTCGLDEQGVVWCWGSNEFGERGNADPEDSPEPTAIAIDGIVTHLSLGAFHACAVTEDDGAFCWGRNVHGQLGTGEPSSEPALVPQQVQPLHRSYR